MLTPTTHHQYAMSILVTMLLILSVQTGAFAGSRQEGVALYDDGMRLFQQADFRGAAQKWEAALSIFKAQDFKKGIGAALFNIGLAYWNLGEYDKALPYYEQALAINRVLGRRQIEGAILFKLGDVNSNLSRYTQALGYYEQALAIQKEMGDRNDQGATLVNLGVVYKNLGQYERALGYYEQALTIYKLTGDRQNQGSALGNIGNVYAALGQYERALGYYEQALTIYKGLRDRDYEGKSLANLGSVYLNLGQYERALRYFGQALTIQKKIGNRYDQGAVLTLIGNVYWNLGQYKRALGYYEQALAIRKAIGDRNGEGTILGNMGSVYWNLGEDAKALSHYEQALAIKRDFGDLDGEGTFLGNIGKVYVNLGQYERALEYYEQALAMHRATSNRESEGFILADIGEAHDLQGRYVQALSHYTLAVRTIESLRGDIGDTELKTSFLDNKLVIYSLLVSLLLRLHREDPTQGYAQQAFEYTERGKARAFLDQLAEARTRVRKGVEPQWLAQEQSLYGQLAATQKRLGNSQSDTEQTALRGHISELERELTTLHQQMRTANPQYAALQFPKPISLADVQRTLLQDSEVLLEYFWGRDALHLFVIDRTNVHALTLPVDEQALTQSLTQFLTPLRPRQTGDRQNFIKTLRQFDLRLAHTLYEQLVQPAVPYLASAKTLLIVPDGVLHYLPFELLVTAPYTAPANPDVMFAEYRDAPYLVRQYAIAYAPSATVLQPDLLYHAQQSTPPSRELLAVAPFGGSASESPPSPSPSFLQKLMQGFFGLTREAGDTIRAVAATPLPHSRREVEAISQVFHPDATTLLAQQATQEAVQTQAGNYRYVHLATHGFVNEAHPMYSGLVFADGEVLQTYEIFNLDLRTDLVTLSACETGLGAFKRGEGLVGLTRAFMYAGTPSVLASLWNVNDAATAEVMTKFYQGLRAGASKARALQQAKEQMMQRQVDGRLQSKRVTISLAHPYFWAPFTLTGGWR